MGWVSSLPNFSACTEIIADLANADLQDPSVIAAARSSPHRFDIISESIPDVPPQTTRFESSSEVLPAATKPFRCPIKYWDIYVDDFCGLVQGNQWTRRLVKRILFQALDKVFRPLDEEDTQFRQEPASVKKLNKGDAR